jgi:alkylation response protein AidB-like acyl-CoA dehydrogenase
VESGSSKDAAGLFSDGIEGARVEQFTERVRSIVEKDIVPLAPTAEVARSFPREAIRALGQAGILRERWSSGRHGDLGMAVVLAETLGSAGFGGIAAGVSLHTEAATSILARFGRQGPLRERLEECLGGDSVACIATSESTVGSDLSSVRTTLVPARGQRWRLRGRKKFVSLAPVADFALVLARIAGAAEDPERGKPAGAAPRLAMVVLDRQDMAIGRTFTPVGLHSLATAPVEFDTEVGPEAIIGPLGAGMLVLQHGLTHERLAIAASAAGMARLAVELAATHLRRRVQFGVPLFEHQALRLRLAELSAITDVLRAAVRGVALTAVVRGHPSGRSVAGLKVTTARLGEKVVSECMHLFGGAGYLEEETPLARLWRDSRIGRIGAGTDEMMWEIVAGGLHGNDVAYDAMVALS